VSRESAFVYDESASGDLHLDTPRTITDTSGNVVWQYDNTDPFGNNVPNENPSNLGQFNFNLRFPGQYFDRETGLNYNRFRDYDASTGRYIESDPIGLDGGLNTYAYVAGNPLISSDPTGQDIFSLLGKAVPSLAPPLALISSLYTGYSISCYLADVKIQLDKVAIAEGGWDVYNAALEACASGNSSACASLQSLYDRALRMSAKAAGGASGVVPKK